MRKGLILFLAVFCLNLAYSQDLVVAKLRSETSRNIKKDSDTTNWNWKHGGLYNLNLSQSSLSNWAAGGDNFNMAINSYFNYFAYYKKERQSWDNNIDVNLGFVQSTSQGGRKNDDRLDVLSKYGYKIDTVGKWYLSGLFNFRSQLFDGYSFSGTKATFTSSLFAPAYMIISAGLDYKPDNNFSLFFSPLTSRTTLVLNKKLADLGKYGVDTGRMVKRETGLFVTVNYNKIIAQNITYKGRADFFSNYYDKPENVNFYMTNMFTFKINKHFSATYSLDLIYDDKIRIFGPLKKSPGLQMKSIIGIGYFRNLTVKKKLIEAKPKPALVVNGE
ncbi:MAG: DUF3078 domain-containing protein [Sediminibacterium sp.]|jgi:hypothetical protein|nr:DUF3078 domain-containing protein [Sediminibacterium sp.]MBP6145053.1 DUF3078 domain-containing protein [Sediminibacterium sp.]